MAWRYLKMVSGGSSSTETNPQEINILAGATKCQVGGTIEATRATMYSQPTALIDGNLTTAAYWAAGPNPTITVTMPADHTDLTAIQIIHGWAHYQHAIYLSQDKINWVQCPFSGWANTNKQQNFSIPALPQTSQNFTANASLNITQFTHGAAQIYTYNPEGGQVVGTPVNWTNGQNVTISNGTLTKTSGGDAWNGAAKGQQYDGNTNMFFQVVADGPKEIAFGFTEVGEPDTVSNLITYKFELKNDLTYHIETLGDPKAEGSIYTTGDIFKIAIEGQQIKFYKNNSLVHTNTITIYYPVYIDASLYTQGQDFTASINGGLEVVTPQDFEQFGTLNIAFTENAQKEYTANGYEFNQGTLTFLDFYFFTDQIYTANGYEQEETILEPLALTETAAQDYTPNGYSFMGVDEQAIILDFAAAQEYTPEGYNFEQSTQENINVAYLGAQAYTAEGYDVATMAQENILLVQTASQVYTANGYSFEATTSQSITAFSDAAAQEYAAHFEQTEQEIINLDIEAAQIFTAHFEQTSLLNFALNIGAAQDYTAIGYTNETTVSETIALDTTTSQIFARHYDQAATDPITLLIATNTEYQANFTSQASQTIFVEDLATATAIFSDGLQFQENAQDNFNLSIAAAQTFTAFGGYEFNQSAINNFALSDAAASIYIMGETGVYNQNATNYLYLQEDAAEVYTRNWLDFESNAAESIGLSFGATSEHLQVNIFEANAAEDLTFFISPLQFYGKYFEATAQNNIGLSINAASERTENYLTFEMQANDFFFLHYTDISVYENNYLQFQQNMYYDFVFWDYADQVYTNNYLEFTPTATEIIDLTIDITSQYTNANMLNGFATENIGLTMAAAVEYVQTIINAFVGLATENINLIFGATSEHIEAQINAFIQFGDESIGLLFGAVSEHIEAHIFDSLAANSFGLNLQALSEYQNINDFKSKAIEPIDFEHWATFLVTTEPRNYETLEQLNFNLKIVNWVYFESDIYQQTYKIEVSKPQSLWVATEQDEKAQEPYVFGTDPITKVNRRILSLTDIDGPTQITYASEIKKPNTLYTKNNEVERGLMDD